MLLKIAAYTVAAAALMMAVKDGRLLAETGLVGSCNAVAAPAGDTWAWQACKPGRLEGRPDLTRRSCTTHGVVGDLELWRCPSSISSGRAV
jgi:hypothetical protein